MSIVHTYLNSLVGKKIKVKDLDLHVHHIIYTYDNDEIDLDVSGETQVIIDEWKEGFVRGLFYIKLRDFDFTQLENGIFCDFDKDNLKFSETSYYPAYVKNPQFTLFVDVL